ncbi:MAG TPA: hypothetical protein VKG24_02540 [Pseudolabrys sp.]|nr:hypothetical protein [Pseudolabrys sp.]
MNKIVRPCGNVAAPAIDRGRADSLTQDRRLERYRKAQREVPARATLMMLWRTNPASGRLECRWVAERGAASDEGVSCSGLLRRAA